MFGARDAARGAVADYHAMDNGVIQLQPSSNHTEQHARSCRTTRAKSLGRLAGFALAVACFALLLAAQVQSKQISIHSTNRASLPDSVEAILRESKGVLVLDPQTYIQELACDLPEGFHATFSDDGVHLDVNVMAVPGLIPRKTVGGALDGQFTQLRSTVLLKPGSYLQLTIEVGYYATVIGLGRMPRDVKVNVADNNQVIKLSM